MKRERRREIPTWIQDQVLLESKRRCCLCYYVEEIRTRRKGQIAHLNHDRTDASIKNLVYLCLDHHDEFDGTTSQSKGFTSGEVRGYRDRLYQELGSTHPQSQAEDPLSFLRRPWRSRWLREGYPEIFAFKSPNGFDGVCRVERIDLEDGRTVMVCEEIEENPGISVTNNVEFIALQLCRQLEIDPNNLILIDHFFYPRVLEFEEDEWDMVQFESRNLDDGFKNPLWIQMESSDWRELGIRPRIRRAPPRRRSLMVRTQGSVS